MVRPNLRTPPGGRPRREGRLLRSSLYCRACNARRRYRKRPWRDVPSDDEMFADEYPDIPLDGLEEIAVETPVLAQP